MILTLLIESSLGPINPTESRWKLWQRKLASNGCGEEGGVPLKFSFSREDLAVSLTTKMELELTLVGNTGLSTAYSLGMDDCLVVLELERSRETTTIRGNFKRARPI